ncbi:MAG: hypothetical protein LUE92_04145 [Clostridiales bacterium]|nr:hypothetical protein [Clostridiales bacterium]
MEKTIVVIDLGTINIKATVMRETGEAMSVQTLPTPVSYGKNSMEIDPERTWTCVLTCCRGALQTASVPIHVDAVVLSSMAASFVPLDYEGMALSPAIGWADARSMPYMDQYMERFLMGERISRCGQYPLPMYAGFKLQWLKAENRGCYNKIRKWVNISELVYNRLLGGTRYVTDYSIASRTMLFDVEQKKWNPAAMEYFEIDSDWLPEALPAGTVVGTAAPETWEVGFSADTKVVLGGHDHMCAIAGAGITKPGIILDSTGTSEAVECLMPADSDPESMAERWINLERSVLPDWAAAVCYIGASGRVYQSACESLQDYDANLSKKLTGELVFLPPQRGQLPSVKGELKGIAPVFDAQQIHRAIRDGMYYECRREIQRILEKKISKERLFVVLEGIPKTVLRCR